MILSFIHKETGKLYTVPVRQVVTYNDNGEPIGISYEQAGFVISTDKNATDFQRVMTLLSIEPLKV